MLSPDDFYSGTIKDAKPLSFIIVKIGTPRETKGLICNSSEPKLVFLNGEFTYKFLKPENIVGLGGLIIPDVRIEVDLDSIYDANRQGNEIGSLVRIEDKINLVAYESEGWGGLVVLTLHDGIQKKAASAVGFRCWQIVMKEGDDKIVLFNHNLLSQSST